LAHRNLTNLRKLKNHRRTETKADKATGTIVVNNLAATLNKGAMIETSALRDSSADPKVGISPLTDRTSQTRVRVKHGVPIRIEIRVPVRIETRVKVTTTSVSSLNPGHQLRSLRVVDPGVKVELKAKTKVTVTKASRRTSDARRTSALVILISVDADPGQCRPTRRQHKLMAMFSLRQKQRRTQETQLPGTLLLPAKTLQMLQAQPTLPPLEITRRLSRRQLVSKLKLESRISSHKLL